MPRYLIFSDIDNTLLQSYIMKDGQVVHIEGYDSIKKIVKDLNNNNVPLILCSSKTRLEQEKIRIELGIYDPFIVENGGAIVVPKDYFPLDLEKFGLATRESEGYLAIELGKSYQQIIDILDEIRTNLGIRCRAVHDFSDSELAKKVGMSVDNAKLMASREYSETLLDIEYEDLEILKKALKARGLTISQGTRYHTISSLHDKGSAVSIVKKLFYKKFENDALECFGIGDAMNDMPMLENVDKPFLVKNIQKEYAPMNIKNLLRVNGIGQEGWKEIILKHVIRCE